MQDHYQLFKLIFVGVLIAGCNDATQSGTADYRPTSFVSDDSPVLNVIAAAGTLKPLDEIEVGSQVSGRIAEVFVDFNDIVFEGDIIARIDPQSFEARVRGAEAALSNASANAMMREGALRRAELEQLIKRADLVKLKARTKSAEASFQQAARTRDRTRELESTHAASVDAMDRASTDLLSAESLLEEYKAAETAQNLLIQSAEASIEVARAELLHAQAVVEEREAELVDMKFALERTSIRSPMNGVVISRNITTGQTVAASLEAPVLFKIARSLSEMEIHARVDEADIALIRVGQLAHFRVISHGDRRFEATIKQVRVAPETIDNVVTYTVVLQAVVTDAILLPGMTAIIEIEAQEPIPDGDSEVNLMNEIPQLPEASKNLRSEPM